MYYINLDIRQLWAAPVQARLNAPPVYRPTTPPAQAKLKAPPIYRPVVPTAPARLAAPPVYRPPATASAQANAVQPFKVLGSSKLLDRMPAKRPWFGYPYAVVERAHFPAQALQRGARPGQEFLTGPLKARIGYTDPSTMSLRVSDDNRMAIEESDLQNRQPKAFYATSSVIHAANTQLQHVQSRFLLKEKGQSIRILTDWTGSEILFKVEPKYLDGGRKKNPNSAPQNCNEMAQKVTGMAAIGMTGGGRASRAASQIAGFGDRPQNTQEDALLPGRYVGGSSSSYRVSSQRANQYAMPDVGDAYMIATQATATPTPGRAGYYRVHDIESGEDRDVPWSYHFAGVVAQSGNDRVTLENYARGDDRQHLADPRWYFQMYGSNRGQSFHEFNKAQKLYANPVTVAIRNPRLPALPRTLDLEAEDAKAFGLALDAF